MKTKWVVTCEHGGNLIPPAYAPYFENADLILQSHRGFDPGALELFHLLAKNLADFSHYSQTSRLLVELNRSLHHKNLFSAYTKTLLPPLKKEIIASYYLPYRERVEKKIRQFCKEENQVVHISVHSFTPELGGQVRNADIGLLYDPSRRGEKEFCESWKRNLQKHLPKMKVRMNYPYHGKADGFTTYLRKRFQERYLGIELEVNQKHAGKTDIQEGIVESLRQIKEKLG